MQNFKLNKKERKHLVRKMWESGKEEGEEVLLNGAQPEEEPHTYI